MTNGQLSRNEIAERKTYLFTPIFLLIVGHFAEHARFVAVVVEHIKQVLRVIHHIVLRGDVHAGVERIVCFAHIMEETARQRLSARWTADGRRHEAIVEGNAFVADVR